ncbi:T9SS type A sorting domain-containing protein [Mariniflexile aquimaris]|uniref:T9SS type A sorting domain-containing protein n=1 Tax=Mariniflexile aquimaris TaxID=881009 RepID=A0ABW3BR92_9FLAO
MRINIAKKFVLILSLLFFGYEVNAQVLWYGDPNLSVNDNFRRLDSDGNSNPTGTECVDDPNNVPFVTTPVDAEFGKFWRVTKPTSRKRAELARTTGDVNSFVPQNGGTYYYGWRWRINATPNLTGGIAVFQWKTDDGGDINNNKQNYPFNMEYDGTFLSLHAFGPAEPNWNRPGSITQRRTTLWKQAVSENQWVSFVVKVNVADSYDSVNNRYQGYIEFWFNGVQQTLSNSDFDQYQVVLANANTRAYHKTFDGIEVYPKWGAYNQNACDFEVITDFDDMRVASTYLEALPSGSNGGNPTNGLEGKYKIKHSITGKYWTVDIANSNIITADEISPNNDAQIFEVKSVGSNGYYNISCTLTGWDAVRFESLNVYPTTTATPTTDTNNTRIFEFVSNGSGAYDIHTPQTTTGRYAYDNSGDVNYTSSATANTKWLLENTNPLSNADFDRNSVFISNPIDNEIIIDGLEKKVNKIEVFNIDGKTIVVKNVKGASSIRIDANTLTSGLYFVKFYGEASIYTRKIIKR